MEPMTISQIDETLKAIEGGSPFVIRKDGESLHLYRGEDGYLKWTWRATAESPTFKKQGLMTVAFFRDLALFDPERILEQISAQARNATKSTDEGKD